MSTRSDYGLVVEGLQIRRGRGMILSDFTWTHRPGAVAWIVGENGAGKSSLLRILAGRMSPTSGSVRLLPSNGDHHEIIYYHPDMNLPDLIRVGEWEGFLHRVQSQKVRHPIDVALLPGTVASGRILAHLSTGEAKRFVLTAILSQDARFVILDEPFEHLSREGKEILTSYLSERARTDIVIVATNQEVPTNAPGPVLHYESDRLELVQTEEV